MMEDGLEDGIEALETLHNGDSEDLHFRFLGTAKSRAFVVNVQFAAAGDGSSQKLRPVEYDFMIGKVLELILKRMGDLPNSALH